MIGCFLKFLSSFALGLMFFLILTPIGFIARLFGRDPLGLKPRTATSYWIERKSSDEPETTTFNRQY
jgi:hypothetical protein